ncbi:hypothetical protein ALC53_08159, partial [Atta colombica]
TPLIKKFRCFYYNLLPDTKRKRLIDSKIGFEVKGTASAINIDDYRKLNARTVPKQVLASAFRRFCANFTREKEILNDRSARQNIIRYQ